MHKEIIFTVFTPTYNRAKTLYRTFQSIQAQTYRNFEWLVIDNCSTDETDLVMQQCIAEANFPLRYLKQTKNLGKHVSFNRGVKEAKGEFFLEIYSDDELVPSALETFYRHWMDIPENERSEYVGVTGLCKDHNGNLVVDKFPKDVLISTPIETYYKYKIRGEKCGFQRLDILRGTLFPTTEEMIRLLPFKNPESLPEDVADGKNYVCESLVWNEIAKKYKSKYVNEYVRIFYTDPRPDRLTLNQMRYTLLTSVVDRFFRIRDWFSYFKHSPINFCKDIVYFHHHRIMINNQFGKKFGLDSIPCAKTLPSQISKILFLGAVPLAHLIYQAKQLRKK